MKQLFIFILVLATSLGFASPVEPVMSVELIKDENDDLSFHIIGKRMNLEQLLHFVKKQRTDFGSFPIEFITHQEIRFADVLVITSRFTDEGLDSPLFYVQVGFEETKDGGGLVKLRSLMLGDVVIKELLSYRRPIREISSDEKLKYDVIEK